MLRLQTACICSLESEHAPQSDSQPPTSELIPTVNANGTDPGSTFVLKTKSLGDEAEEN